MLRHFTLLMLVCALIVPRLAWGAHEAGHDQSVDSITQHVHHDGHSHEVVVDVENVHLTNGDNGEGGLLHNHLPADVLSVMAGSNAADDTGNAFLFASLHLIDRHRTGQPSVAPDSLLRPPRAA